MGIQINGQTDTVTAIDGSLNVGGDVTIPGVLTYDDVTNVDSVGVITARDGIRVTGDVGINRPTPSASLDVESTSDQTVLRIRNNAGNNTRLLFANKAAGLGEIFYQGDFRFVDDENSDAERLRITSDGKVGINTASPRAVLDVEGNSENAILMLHSNDANANLQFSDNSGGARILNYGGDLAFRTGTNAHVFGTGDSERLRITSGGDTEIRNTVAGVTDAYSQSLKFRTTQTNGQSAITGAIAAQGKASWGGDLVFYTKQANATPNDTVTETLRIDTAGRITKPYQPRFFAYATSSASVGSGYQTVAIWNQTRFNVGSHFSTSTDVFTAPIAGCYLFGTQVRFDAANVGYFRLILSINNSTEDNQQGHSITDSNGTTGDSYHTMAVTALYELNQGDNVRVLVEGNSDTSWTIQSESQFWGYLVA